MKELLAYIARHLVDNPDQVSVEAVMRWRYPDPAAPRSPGGHG